MIKKAIPHSIAILIFVALSALYFIPQLQGKRIQQGDIISYKSMIHELEQYEEQTGERPLWSNAQFGGMPMYQTGVEQKKNLITYVQKASHLFLSRPIGYFVTGMLCFYIMLLAMGCNAWLSLLGAVAFGFTTNQMVLYEAGHTSKFLAVAYSSLILAGMYVAYVRKKLWLGAVLFTIGLALELRVNHVQMTYYLFIVAVIWGLMLLVDSIRKKELAGFAKTTGVLLIGIILSVGSFASKIWPTYEYQKDTMRGEPILEKTSSSNGQSSSETDGLAYDYAMQWSNGTLDLVATLIPNVVGGGSAAEVSADTESGKVFRRSGMRANPGGSYQVPLYWGNLPFTSGPVYYGAAVFLFFMLGMLLYKGNFRWWILSAVILTFLLSLGSNFDALQKLFFNNLPLYNKFRAPSSILSITAIFFPLMGALGIRELMRDEHTQKEKLKALYTAAGALGAVCLFFVLLGPSMFDFSSPADANYANTPLPDALRADRQSAMRSSALRSLFIILAAAGILWAYITNKLKMIPMLAVLGVLTLGDLWLVDKQYLNNNDFTNANRYSANFAPREVDQQIMQNEPHRGAYRVLDLSVNTFNSAATSYHHNTIGGYHPAKLQRYQDIIDRHIMQNNQQVLNMLNTKYIISREQQASQNPDALGNAWLVSSFKTVATANAEIDALSNFNAAEEAVVHQEFANYISGLTPSGAGSISLENYHPDHLTYQANVSGEQFAVFSEVWYGPGKGWQAYIDGEPVEHIRVNYLLRGLRIPAGQHKVEFVFNPSSYYTGETISLICSLIIILGLIGYLVYWFRKNKETVMA